MNLHFVQICILFYTNLYIPICIILEFVYINLYVIRRSGRPPLGTCLPLSAPALCCVVCHPIASRCILRPTPLFRPLILLLRRLVVACCVASVAGVFVIVAPTPTPLSHWCCCRCCAFFGNQRCQQNNGIVASAMRALVRVHCVLASIASTFAVVAPTPMPSLQWRHCHCCAFFGSQRCQCNDGNNTSATNALVGVQQQQRHQQQRQHDN